MAKRILKKSAGNDKESAPDVLKGWRQISAFLGEPVSVIQRWASEGMPVRREGRFVSTTPDELNAWLSKQSGKPVHVATKTGDLTAELKRGLSFVWSQSDHASTEGSQASRRRRKMSG